MKVSDYRSALIQGKFLAKKGLWVSEYRIESGLNCGGHAFATDGHLMGSILAQFRDRREEFIDETNSILIKALSHKKRYIPKSPLPIKFTAQGGVGTAEEHTFLLEHYKIDSIGWGTPFLLVPEATTVDNSSLEKLVKAKEDDLYLSNISPLGIPFHSLKGNTKDEEKIALIRKERPGSSCPKKFVALNKEFTEKGICTASRQYQNLKINGHIYGESNVIKRTDRPNIFIKELTIYIDFIKTKIEEAGSLIDVKQKKYNALFVKNLKESIDYYREVFSNSINEFESSKSKIMNDLEINESILNQLKLKIDTT